MGSNKIMDKETILQLISNEKWFDLVREFNVNDIDHLFNYRDSMALAYDLFFKNLEIDKIQNFSISLFFSISHAYPTEWNADWKTDAFLGNLCSITWKYDEMYELYKKAYDKLTDPPESLLLLLAGCNSVPGIPPISDLESKQYLQRAIAKKMTYEAALMMKGLAMDNEDKELEDYWDRICQELTQKNIHTETIIPDILISQNRR